MTQIESRWKELSNGILVDIWVQNLTPNHPFPLQNPGIAASNRFWPSPPRNSYYPQFGSASARTISLIHSWCGPSLGMVCVCVWPPVEEGYLLTRYQPQGEFTPPNACNVIPPPDSAHQPLPGEILADGFPLALDNAYGTATGLPVGVLPGASLCDT